MTNTYSLARVPVKQETFDEIRKILESAGYTNQIKKDNVEGLNRDLIDVSGLAIVPRDPPPHRRFEAVLHVSGDTIGDVIGLLDHLTGHIQQGGRGCAVGGVSEGGWMEVKEDASIDHQAYVAALETYKHKQKARDRATD